MEGKDHSQDNDVMKDLEEIKELLKIAKRPAIRAFLQDKQNQLEASIAKVRPEYRDMTDIILQKKEAQEVTRAPLKTTSQPAPATNEIIYQKLSSYAWDQSLKFVSVYITLEGLDKADPSQIRCDFATTEFDLKIHNISGKNYRLKLPLFHTIVVSESNYTIKGNRITIKLKKKDMVKKAYGEDFNWDKLEASFRQVVLFTFYAELCTHIISQKDTSMDKYATGQDMKVDEQQSVPVLDVKKILKEMYKEGDDETKREVMRAVYESRKEGQM